jgi:hypothetical protein
LVTEREREKQKEGEGGKEGEGEGEVGLTGRQTYRLEQR